MRRHVAPQRAPPFFWDELRPGPARDAFERFFEKDTDDAGRVQIARKILSLDVVTAHCMLFDVYQRACMDSRWGPSNPLDELVGVMRVKAIGILRRRDHPRGRKHAAAAQVLARAAKPKDIPLILSRLDHPSHPELPMWLFWALGNAVADLESADMALIEAMERRLVPGREREVCSDRLEASRILEAHRVKAAEEALLRALPRLAPDEAIPVVTALLAHDPLRHLDAARRIRDLLPEGYPRGEDLKLGMGYPHLVFLEAVKSAEQNGAAEMAERARIAQIRQALEADPRSALPALRGGLGREECAALTPTLCRLLAASDEASARDVLRALGHGAAPTRTLFHALEPWLSHADLELRGLAMRAAFASRSDQARARLVSRLRRSCVDDAADAARAAGRRALGGRR
jgi:hypothetical protein